MNQATFVEAYKNANILLQFITKLVDMFNPLQIFIYIYTKISTMININNFNIFNHYVKIRKTQ